MGTFRIEIKAVGGHGEMRNRGDGELLPFHQYPYGSVDVVAHQAVQSLRERGASVSSARIVHWPGTDAEVVDDVLSATRHGSF